MCRMIFLKVILRDRGFMFPRRTRLCPRARCCPASKPTLTEPSQTPSPTEFTRSRSTGLSLKFSHCSSETHKSESNPMSSVYFSSHVCEMTLKTTHKSTIRLPRLQLNKSVFYNINRKSNQNCNQISNFLKPFSQSDENTIKKDENCLCTPLALEITLD